MVLLAVLLWSLLAVLLGAAVYGPRRWHAAYTTHVRPGTPEPDDDGYFWLHLRNWGLLLLGAAIAVPVTLDGARTSTEELTTLTARAAGLIPDGELTPERLAAETAVLADREVSTDDVTDDLEEAGLIEPTSGNAGAGDVYYEVTLGELVYPDSDDYDLDAAASCVRGLMTRGTLDPQVSVQEVLPGRCAAGDNLS